MRRGQPEPGEYDWDHPAGPVRVGGQRRPPRVAARGIVDRLAWTDWPRVLWTGAGPAKSAKPGASLGAAPEAGELALETVAESIARRLQYQPVGVCAVRLAPPALGEIIEAEGEKRLAELLRQSNRSVSDVLPLRDAVARGSHDLLDSRRFPKALPQLVGDAERWWREKEDDLRDARAALDAADAWALASKAAATDPSAALSPAWLVLESLCLWIGSEQDRPSRRLEPAAVAAALHRATPAAATAARAGSLDAFGQAAWAFLGQKRFQRKPTGAAFGWYQCGRVLRGWPLDVLVHVARAVGGPGALAEQVRAARELAGAAAAAVLRELLLSGAGARVAGLNSGQGRSTEPSASPGRAGGAGIREAIQSLPALVKLFKSRTPLLLAAARAGALVPAALAGVEQWARACAAALPDAGDGGDGSKGGGGSVALELAVAGLLEAGACAARAGLDAAQRSEAFDAAGRHARWLLEEAPPVRSTTPPAPPGAALPPPARGRLAFLCAATAAGLDARRLDSVVESGLSGCVAAALSVQPKRVADLLHWLGGLGGASSLANSVAAQRSLLDRWGLTGRSSYRWGYAFALLNPAAVARYFEWARRLPEVAPRLKGRWEPMDLMRWLFDLALPPEYGQRAPALAAEPEAALNVPGTASAGPKAAFLSRHAERLLGAAEALLRRPPLAGEVDPAEAARQRLGHWQRCAEIACEWAALKLPEAPAAFDRLLATYPLNGRRALFDRYGGLPLQTLLRVCDGRPERAAVLATVKLDLSWEEAEQIARAWDCVAAIEAARDFFSGVAGQIKCAARALRLLSRLGFCIRLQGERRLREKLRALFAPEEADSAGDASSPVGPSRAPAEPGRAGPVGPKARPPSSSPPPSPTNLSGAPPEHVQSLLLLLRLRADGRLPARIEAILRRPGQLLEELRTLEAKPGLSLSARSRAEKVRRLLDDPVGLGQAVRTDLHAALPEALDEARFKAMEQLVEDVTDGHVRKIIGVTPPRGGAAGTGEGGRAGRADPAEPWDDSEDEARNWENAVRLYFSVPKNRKPLKRLMWHEARGDRRWLGEYPPNRAFLDRVSGRGVDAGAWLAPFARAVATPAGPWRIAVETNPLHVLRMSNYFDTCLSEGREYAYSTIANAVEANKRVVYVRDERGDVIGRKLLVMTPEAEIVGFRSYGTGPLDPWLESQAGPSPWMKIHLDAFCREWADACRSRLYPFPARGAGDTDPRSEDGLRIFAFWYNDSPEPFDPLWLAHSPADLRPGAIGTAATVGASGSVLEEILEPLCYADDEAAAPWLRAVLWLGDGAAGVVSALLRRAEADPAGPVAARASAVVEYIARHALPGELRRIAEAASMTRITKATCT